MDKEEVLKKISEIFPKADIVDLSYYGDGDSFEEFSELCTRCKLDEPIKHEGTKWNPEGWIQEYEEVHLNNHNDYEEIERFLKLKVSAENTVENYIWEIFEKANNSPDFNNAGSCGIISFDIKNNIVELSNTYKDYHYDDDGNIDWDQDDVENECETEKF